MKVCKSFGDGAQKALAALCWNAPLAVMRVRPLVARIVQSLHGSHEKRKRTEITTIKAIRILKRSAVIAFQQHRHSLRETKALPFDTKQERFVRPPSGQESLLYRYDSDALFREEQFL